MTVTLHLKSELEAGLLAQAQAMGVKLEDYLLILVEACAVPDRPYPGTTQTEDRATAVRRMLDFGETHHLSLEEPITRALLHEDHRF